MTERLFLFDTTLRDGAQTQGVDFSTDDKRRIARMLDELKMDYVEGGWPGANPVDTEFFDAPPAFSHARLTAFGMTRRSGRSADNDPGLTALLQCDAPAVCLVAKSWDFHVEVALEISLKENLACISDSIAAVKDRGREAMMDAEHFFDGYKANPDYALACLKAAHESGARWLVLCDTNGGTLPHEITRIVGEVAKVIPGESLGIHAHDDTGNAVANTLAAVQAGVRQVQGTLNGLGERCGNANMITLLPTLLLKPGFSGQFQTGVTMDGLKKLTAVSRVMDDILNQAPRRQAAYVGESAFAHKGGLHVSAVRKDPKTYEHIPPESTGNRRSILVSGQAGRANVLERLETLGITADPSDKRVQHLLDVVKERETLGYSYDGADASFELLARRTLGAVPAYFDVESFRVLVERRRNALGKRVTVSEATVRLNVNGHKVLSVGEGNGPVNALDHAMRKDLGQYSRWIEDLRLVDYKVRILGSGTSAVTRVLVESATEKGEHWFTVGVSPNIVEASFQALMDSMVYKLLREGAPAPESSKESSESSESSSGKTSSTPATV